MPFNVLRLYRPIQGPHRPLTTGHGACLRLDSLSSRREAVKPWWRLGPSILAVRADPGGIRRRRAGGHLARHPNTLKDSRSMNRLRTLVSCGILGMALNGLAATSALAGEWVSLFDGQTLSGWTKGGGRAEQQVGGRGRGHPGFGPGLDALQPARATTRTSSSGPRSRSTTTATRVCTSAARSPTAASREGYEAQIDSTHADPIRTGSIYGFVHVYKQYRPARYLVHLRGRGGRQELARQGRAAHQGVDQRRSCSSS